jgi:hypothetical protein
VSQVPPPGVSLLFVEWTNALVAELRSMLPDVSAVRKRGAVRLSRTGSQRVVDITEAGTTFWLATHDAGAPMATLCDGDRHDLHTARTFARSIAGGYDAALSRPER